MLDHLLACGLLILEHILDEVNSPARTVEFISQQQIGRACGGTKTTMNASTENFLRFTHVRLGKRDQREVRLHGIPVSISDAGIHSSEIENTVGIERELDPSGQLSKRR